MRPCPCAASVPDVAKQRDLTLLLVATALSSLGDELALIALTIKVFELSHSALSVTALLVAGLLPMVVFAPVAGLLVDRSEKVHLVAVVAVIQAILAFAMAGTLNVPAILVLSFLLGTGAAISSPTLVAIVPSIVRDGDTTKANAWLEAGRYAGWVLGPILGGVLAQTVGSGWALSVDGISFIVIAAAVLSLSVRCPPENHEENEKHAARKGFGFVWSDPVLRVTVTILVATVLFAAIDNVAEVFFAREVLHAGSWGFGAIASAWLTGMVIGATGIARRLPPGRLPLAVIGGSLGIGAFVLAGAAIGRTVPAIAFFFAAGIGNGVQNVSIRSLIHARVPEHLRGRVFAAYFGLLTFMQIGATVLGGVLIGAFGARAALIISGGGGVGVALLGLLWLGSSDVAVQETIVVPELGPVVKIPETETSQDPL
ncbi:MAG: hypothetical protein QOE83_1090 [Actinomycetota bacterium]|nr:hypothetical protein [Actinomycetota bacterium]